MAEIVPVYPYRDNYPTECQFGEPLPGENRLKFVLSYGESNDAMIQHCMTAMWYQHDFGDHREGIDWAMSRGAILAADLIAQRRVQTRRNFWLSERYHGWFLLFENHRDAIEYMLRYR